MAVRGFSSGFLQTKQILGQREWRTMITAKTNMGHALFRSTSQTVRIRMQYNASADGAEPLGILALEHQ
jgi:hypothetical protein